MNGGHWRRRYLRYSVSVVIPGALVLLLGRDLWLFAQRIAVASVQQAQSQDLEQAMNQWNQEGPEKYRLTLSIGGRWGQCRQRLRIEEGSSVTIVEEGCTAPFGTQMYRYLGSPMTVIDLFDYVKTVISTRSCGPNGCRCDGALTLELAYDEHLGYPQSILTSFKRHWTASAWPLSLESRQGLHVDRGGPS